MRILIIEDNSTISENISLYLKAKGHTPEIAKNGAIAFDMITRSKYDFLIVDRMMPEIDGLSLIRMLRARSIAIPFLFLTALGKQTDKIEGLSLGADDYLVKPFDLEELRLRIENIARRNTGTTPSITSHNMSISDVSLDTDARSVSRAGKMVELSPKEYDLFATLMEHRGHVLDRDTLYERVWGEYDADPLTLETINVHVAHLRKKLGADVIRTVKLVGYVIDV